MSQETEVQDPEELAAMIKARNANRAAAKAAITPPKAPVLGRRKAFIASNKLELSPPQKLGRRNAFRVGDNFSGIAANAEAASAEAANAEAAAANANVNLQEAANSKLQTINENEEQTGGRRSHRKSHHKRKSHRKSHHKRKSHRKSHHKRKSHRRKSHRRKTHRR